MKPVLLYIHRIFSPHTLVHHNFTTIIYLINLNGLLAMYDPSTTVTTATRSVIMAEGSKVEGGGTKGPRERLEKEREWRISQPLALLTSRTGMEGV